MAIGEQYSSTLDKAMGWLEQRRREAATTLAVFAFAGSLAACSGEDGKPGTAELTYDGNPLNGLALVCMPDSYNEYKIDCTGAICDGETPVSVSTTFWRDDGETGVYEDYVQRIVNPPFVSASADEESEVNFCTDGSPAYEFKKVSSEGSTTTYAVTIPTLTTADGSTLTIFKNESEIYENPQYSAEYTDKFREDTPQSDQTDNGGGM